MLLVGVLILMLHGAAVPIWPWLLLAHAVAIGCVHALIVFHAKFPDNQLLGFVRSYYPILLYGAFYRETGELNQMVVTGFVDPVFFRLEEKVFGGQPSVKFMEWLPHPWVSEIFYAAYFSYYVMIGGVGLALYLQNRRQFDHYLAVVSFVFYVCYLTYIFLPVIGPPLFHKTVHGYSLPPEFQPVEPLQVPAGIESGLFYRIMGWIYENIEAPGAAFPSSHVAVALVTLYFSFLYLRPIRFVHLIAVLLLSLATVYCRYHFAVDVIAGAATALVLIPLGNWLYQRFQKPQDSGTGDLQGATAQSGRS